MSNRKMPVKTVRFKFKGDYEGWWMDIRTNPPLGIFLEAISQFEASDKEDVATIYPALVKMLGITIVKWNAVDESGADLALPGGIRELPLELLMLIAERVQDVTVAIPKEPKSS